MCHTTLAWGRVMCAWWGRGGVGAGHPHHQPVPGPGGTPACPCLQPGGVVLSRGPAFRRCAQWGGHDGNARLHFSAPGSPTNLFAVVFFDLTFFSIFFQFWTWVFPISTLCSLIAGLNNLGFPFAEPQDFIWGKAFILFSVVQTHTHTNIYR